jgi:hypothetical protein
MNKQFIIYKTTCLINQKFYIGQHETNDINDSYLGSGLLICASIKKYGKENFIKEILHVFDNKHDMNLKEAEIVNLDLLKNPLCLNLSPGGQGGNLGDGASLKNKLKWTPERRTEQSNRMKELRKREDVIEKCKNKSGPCPETRRKIAKTLTGHVQSEETKLKRAESNRGQTRSKETKSKIGDGNRGLIRSEETKQKLSESAKKRTKQAWTGKKRPTKECPHCNKVGADYLMTRWHFDNCKNLWKK